MRSLNEPDLTINRSRTLSELGSPARPTVEDRARQLVAPGVSQQQVDDLFIGLDYVQLKNQQMLADLAVAASAEYIPTDGRPEIARMARTVLDGFDHANGSRIPFNGFKFLVDRASAPIDLTRFTTAMSSGDVKLATEAINQYAQERENPNYFDAVMKQARDKMNQMDGKFWLSMGIAAASLLLLNALSRMKGLSPKDNEGELRRLQALLDVLESSTSFGPKEAAQQAALKAQIASLKLRIRVDHIISIAEAVAFFIQFNNLTKDESMQVLQYVGTANQMNQEEQVKLSDTVNLKLSTPDEEIAQLLAMQSGGDARTLVEYCAQYIDEHPAAAYEKWTLYLQAAIRGRNLRQAVAQSPAYISPAAKAAAPRLQQQAAQPLQVTQVLGGIMDLGQLMDQTEYPGRPTRRMSAGYFQLMSAYRDEANVGLNYARRLANSNKYSASQICCLAHYLGTHDTDSLKKIRALLRMLSRGVGFNASRAAQDLANALYSDLQRQLLMPLMALIDATVRKWIEEVIMPWLADVEKRNKVLFLCFPIKDLAMALIGVIEDLEQLINDLLQQLFDLLFKVEINQGVLLPVITGRLRLKTMTDLLDLIIDLLDQMNQCDLLAVRDIVQQQRRTEPVISVPSDSALKGLLAVDNGLPHAINDRQGRPLDNDVLDHTNQDLADLWGSYVVGPPTDAEIAGEYRRATDDAILNNEFCRARMSPDEYSHMQAQAKAMFAMFDQLKAAT